MLAVAADTDGSIGRPDNDHASFSSMPRFDEPLLTTPCAELDVEVPTQEPMPPLVEPATFPRVDQPSADPLVPLEAPNIVVLSNYYGAGWKHAIPATWLRSTVLERLSRAASSLPDRWGLCVFDAWRPLPLQAELFDAAYQDPTLPPGFVSVPDEDPATPPPHLTGGTVDVSLTSDGVPLGLGGGFDDFTSRAHADAYEGEPGTERELRRLLYWTMRAQGFVVLNCEWWHFEYGTRRWAAITANPPIFGPAQPPVG